jgi:hypothetical protein
VDVLIGGVMAGFLLVLFKAPFMVILLTVVMLQASAELTALLPGVEARMADQITSDRKCAPAAMRPNPSASPTTVPAASEACATRGLRFRQIHHPAP